MEARVKVIWSEDSPDPSDKKRRLGGKAPCVGIWTLSASGVGRFSAGLVGEMRRCERVLYTVPLPPPI